MIIDTRAQTEYARSISAWAPCSASPQGSSAHYYVSFNLEQVESHPRTLHLPFRPPNSPLNPPQPSHFLNLFHSVGGTLKEPAVL